MKIKNVDKFPISLHFTKAGFREEDKALSVWARGVYPIIIRINTDEGISGLGEATTITHYFGETQEGMMKLLESYERLLVGEGLFELIELASLSRKCLAYRRIHENQEVYVYLNFSQDQLKLECPVRKPVLLFSTSANTMAIDEGSSSGILMLGPLEGIILEEIRRFKVTEVTKGERGGEQEVKYDWQHATMCRFSTPACPYSPLGWGSLANSL